jgi:hypothetical protein
MKKAMLQAPAWNDSTSLFALLLTRGLDATLAYLCTSFVFTDD